MKGERLELVRGSGNVFRDLGRIYRELAPMKSDQLDLVNRTVWIPDSKIRV